MPSLDGTGPNGTGPRQGRAPGRPSRRTSGRQRSRRKQAGGSAECECPKCQATVSHKRGVPCSEVKCPKCGTLMRGKFCK